MMRDKHLLITLAMLAVSYGILALAFIATRPECVFQKCGSEPHVCLGAIIRASEKNQGAIHE